MDLYCPFCAEPWDNDSFHEEVDYRVGNGGTATYQQVAREFRRYGCGALTFTTDLPVRKCDSGQDADPTRLAVIGAAYELLGDDMDGAAAMLSDYGI